MPPAFDEETALTANADPSTEAETAFTIVAETVLANAKQGIRLYERRIKRHYHAPDEGHFGIGVWGVEHQKVTTRAIRNERQAESEVNKAVQIVMRDFTVVPTGTDTGA